MKQAIYIIILFHSLLFLANLNCSGIDDYTVQIAASKTPTDVNLFSKKHQIDQKIVEIKENGWYKYVIGQFGSNRAASDYIALNLHSKGLPGPFPRILPDSLKEYSEKKLTSEAKAIPDAKESIPEMTIDSATTPENARFIQTFSTDSIITDLAIQKRTDKYSRWEKMISWEKMENIESYLKSLAKSFPPRSFVPFYVRIIDKAIRFPVILFFLMLIVLFVLNALLIMIFLELSNTSKNKTERFIDLYQAYYERILTGYLFQEFDIETAISRMKKIKDHRNRKIFVSVLFNFQKNLSGDSDQKILEIFYRLALHEDALKKIKSSSLYYQIIGLRELTNLYPLGALSIVESHINVKKDELRAEAQTSYVRLNHEEPFGFVKKLRKPFTRWTQLTSFYIFKLHKLPAPSFAEFLQSDMYNVQNFSLRMITYFQQQENAEGIIKLVSTVRNQTRYLAIKAISDLGIREAKPLLKERFETEIDRNKLEIVKALQHIGDHDDFDFLEKIIMGDDVSLKIEACRSMYFMDSAGAENLIRLKKEKELFLGPYYAHINDPRN